MNDKIIPALAAMITAFITISNYSAAKTRNKLKDDFDILKKFREELEVNKEENNSELAYKKTKAYEELREKIINRLYKKYALHGFDQSDLLTALVFVLLTLTPWFLKGEDVLTKFIINWKLLLTGAGLVGAVYFSLRAYRERGKEKD